MGEIQDKLCLDGTDKSRRAVPKCPKNYGARPPDPTASAERPVHSTRFPPTRTNAGKSASIESNDEQSTERHVFRHKHRVKPKTILQICHHILTISSQHAQSAITKNRPKSPKLLWNKTSFTTDKKKKNSVFDQVKCVRICYHLFIPPTSQIL